MSPLRPNLATKNTCYVPPPTPDKNSGLTLQQKAKTSSKYVDCLSGFASPPCHQLWHFSREWQRLSAHYELRHRGWQSLDKDCVFSMAVAQRVWETEWQRGSGRRGEIERRYGDGRLQQVLKNPFMRLAVQQKCMFNWEMDVKLSKTARKEYLHLHHLPHSKYHPKTKVSILSHWNELTLGSLLHCL